MLGADQRREPRRGCRLSRKLLSLPSAGPRVGGGSRFLPGSGQPWASRSGRASRLPPASPALTGSGSFFTCMFSHICKLSVPMFPTCMCLRVCSRVLHVCTCMILHEFLTCIFSPPALLAVLSRAVQTAQARVGCRRKPRRVFRRTEPFLLLPCQHAVKSPPYLTSSCVHDSLHNPLLPSEFIFLLFKMQPRW